MFLFAALVSRGQINQDIRREFAGADYDEFTLAPFGELGVIVFGNDRVNMSIQKWKFYKLDKYLNDLDSISFDLPSQLALVEFYTTDQSLVLLYASIKRRTYRITEIDFNSMKLKHYNGKLPPRPFFGDMKVCGSTTYITLLSKRKPVLMALDMESGVMRQENMEIKGRKRVWFEGLEVDTASQEAFVFLGFIIKGKMTGINVQIWDETGRRMDIFDLSDEKDKNLTAIRGTRVDAGHYIFAGTYSQRSATTGSGFFLAEMKNGKRTYLKYFNFLDLDNFTDYLPKRQQDRMERKKKARAAKGSTLAVDYLMLPHSVLSSGEINYFLGEFYYPTYRYVTRTTYVNGRPQTTTERVFDGYQYTHASLICFDRSGTKLWDATFEMWLDYKPMILYRFITMRVDSEGTVDLMFPCRDKLYIKSYNDSGKITRDRSYKGIDTGGEDDKVTRSFSLMKHWYDNHFLAFGYQRIKDRGKTDGRKVRKVFFVNKVSPE